MLPTKIASRLQVLYLLALAVVLFVLRQPWPLLALFGLQVGLWGAAGTLLPVLRIFRRLLFFFLLILLSYAFLPLSGGADIWWGADMGGWAPRVNLAGIEVAALMCLRVWTLVMASAWVQQTASAEGFVGALRDLRVPEFLAITIVVTLSLVAGQGGGGAKGGGRGKGGGKNRAGPEAGEQADEEAGEQADEQGGGRLAGIGRILARIGKGDWSFLSDSVTSGLERAQRGIAAQHPGMAEQRTAELALIAGVALAILSLKMMRVMPGLPLAPGHKNLVMIPLFLLAAHWSTLRLGGLWTGITVGVVSFLLGFGKYGILEVAQFAVPGLMADLLSPLLKARSRGGRLAQFVLVGLLLGLGRFAANILVIVLAGAPQAAFVIFLPMLFSQMAFGGLSGLVSLAIIQPGGGPGETKGSGDKEGEEEGRLPG